MDGLRLIWRWPEARERSKVRVLELSGPTATLDGRLSVTLTQAQADEIGGLIRATEPWRFPQRAFCGVKSGRLEVVGPQGSITSELGVDVDEDIASPFWLELTFGAVDVVVGVLSSLGLVLDNLSARIAEDVERTGTSTRTLSPLWRPSMDGVLCGGHYASKERLLLRMQQLDSYQTVTRVWFASGRALREVDGKQVGETRADPQRVIALIREMRDELGLVGVPSTREGAVARRGSRVVTYAYGGSSLQWEASPHIETEMGVQVDRHIFPGLSPEQERALELLTRLGA